ncbi:hypothetical protein UA75_03000 [Actinoalloteichus sp. GBA129-24]|uniref:Uncharacterized protein n=1 Tax=Actinoalloteichus fjordicus TaxID=1612552 RepID=A0AAC9PQ37_9PSEU|nr:hypothetical protein UA74_02910 [Actinoalloteichus fjordicus]APU18635.1 hypothetical protein UA75_03000 [Actinoalloteichus sp. GBA129-24]
MRTEKRRRRPGGHRITPARDLDRDQPVECIRPWAVRHRWELRREARGEKAQRAGPTPDVTAYAEATGDSRAVHAVTEPLDVFLDRPLVFCGGLPVCAG